MSKRNSLGRRKSDADKNKQEEIPMNLIRIDATHKLESTLGTVAINREVF